MAWIAMPDGRIHWDDPHQPTQSVCGVKLVGAKGGRTFPLSNERFCRECRKKTAMVDVRHPQDE